MQTNSAKALLVATWALGIIALGLVGEVREPSSWAIMTAFGLVPAWVFLRFWSDPPSSMSESIHKARR